MPPNLFENNRLMQCSARNCYCICRESECKLRDTDGTPFCKWCGMRMVEYKLPPLKGGLER